MLFIVNDRVTVAANVGAGVHVGQADDPGAAREILGETAVLGISVSTPDEASAAEVAGADYLGVTVWATPTVPDASRAVWTVAEDWRETALPVVGIGGINTENAAEVLDAGAAGIAWSRRSARRRTPSATRRRGGTPGP